MGVPLANKFKKGDVVVLKSGGPPMTVDGLPGEHMLRKQGGEYLCIWFKGVSKEVGYFSEHLLDTFTPPAKK